MPSIKLLHLTCLKTLLLFAAVSLSANSQQLANPGFETPYGPVNVSSSDKNITGVVANSWFDNSAWAGATVAYSQETQNCHGGSSCQKIAVGSVGQGYVQFGQTIQAQAGQLYTPGIWIRGTAGSVVYLELAQSNAPYNTYEDVPAYLTGSWQFVSVPSHAMQTIYLNFFVVSYTAQTFWVDDASLPSQASPVTTDFTVPKPALAAFGMHISNYLASKSPANLNFEDIFLPVVANNTTETISGQMGHFWFDSSASVSINYQANTSTPHSGKSAQRLVVSQVKPSGYAQIGQLVYLRLGQTYTVSVWVRGTLGMQLNFYVGGPNSVYANQAVTATGAWQQLTVKPTANASGISALILQTTSVGTIDLDDAALVGSNGETPNLALPWPSTSFGTWRTWDQAGCAWRVLERANGVWDFSLLDDAVNDAVAHNVQIVFTLGQTPAWASARPTEPGNYGPGAAAEPANVADWTSYITTVASRYKGKILHYEIWNEPNDPGYYSGSIATLVSLTQAAQKALKAVDPNIQVLAPPPYSAGYLKEFLAAGGGKYVDTIGYHIYISPPEEDARVLADLRTIIAAAGFSSKPLYITEGATVGADVSDETTSAGLLARKYIVDLGFGASLLDWYTWGPLSACTAGAASFCLPTTEPDGITPTKAGTALEYLTGALVGAQFQAGSIDSAGNWVLQIITTAGTPGYVVWNPNNPKASWTVPTGFKPTQLKDLFGGTANVTGQTSINVTTQPVLIN